MARPAMVEDARLRAGNASRGGLLAADVRVLRGRWQRLRQAWGRRLHAGQGLLLLPAPAVHALGARHPLRVVYLDSSARVLAEQVLPRWRATPSPDRTASALILHPENPARVEPGDQVEWLSGQPRLPGRADWLEQAATSQPTP